MPIYDNDGGVDRLLGITQDITAQKRAESALIESEQRYRMVFDMASDSIVLIDPNTQDFVEFNQTAHERLGYTRDEFAKLTVRDIEAAESPAEIATRLQEIAKQGSQRFNTQHRSRNGDIHDRQVRVKTIDIGDKQLLLNTWRDISQSDAGH